MTNILSTKKIKDSLVKEALRLGLRVLAHDFIETKHLCGLSEAQAIRNAQQHLIFTSSNAVKAYQKTITAHGLELAPKKVHCLQGETLDAVARLGNVEIVSRAENARELALGILRKKEVEKASFFCGDKRLDTLPRLLRQQNIELEETVLYHTVLTSRHIAVPYQAVLFFSPSAVESFFQGNSLPEHIPCYCIGQTTKNRLREFTDNETIVARDCSQEAVLRAVVEKIAHNDTTTQRTLYYDSPDFCD